jgi:hypothetical protein
MRRPFPGRAARSPPGSGSRAPSAGGGHCKALDEVEQRQRRLGAVLEAFPVEQLALQGSEEALRHGVVEAVAHRPIEGTPPGLAATPAEGERCVPPGSPSCLATGHICAPTARAARNGSRHCSTAQSRASRSGWLSEPSPLAIRCSQRTTQSRPQKEINSRIIAPTSTALL